MAKKIQIDIEVNGKMQKATVSAKKLRDALSGVEDASDRVGKSARQTDRNIKGTAQASSNATKNFSKMSQGMGGLVGAYASLAASLFAVSAAFNFLKSAGELKSLRAGQIAYASSTGVAINTLTNDIIRATDSQIAFRDAAQAAAIGSAAGLNADQLIRLGKAAADASQILGRDVTDSFNRLVRGATKAEPELLDELGIILRLDDASKNYATALNLNANELTTFQKQQAVTNEILTQAETKYGKILDIVGRSPNQYAQLQKAFDDIIMSVKEVVDMVAGPLAKVLQETPALAVASLGVLLSGPLKALGLSFSGIAEGSREAANDQLEFYRSVKEEVKQAAKTTDDYKKDLKALANIGMADGAKAGFLTTLSRGKDLSGAEVARFQKAVTAAENHVNSAGVVVKGAFTGMKIHMVREMSEAYTAMNAAQASTLKKTELFALRGKALFAGLGAVAKGVASGIATSFSKALSAVSYAGLAFTGFQMYKEFTKGPATKEEMEIAKQAEAAEVFLDRLTSINKEFEKFAAVQAEMSSRGSTKFYENMSSFFSANTTEEISQITDILKETGVAQKEMAETAQESNRKLLISFASVAGGVYLLKNALDSVAAAAPNPVVKLLAKGAAIVAGGAAGYFAGREGGEALQDKGLLDETRKELNTENERNKQIKIRLEGMRDVLQTAKETSAISFPEIDKLLKILNEIIKTDGPINEALAENFKQTHMEVSTLVDELNASAQAMQELNTKTQNFFNSMFKVSQASTIASETLVQLEEARRNLEDIVVAGGTKPGAFQEQSRKVTELQQRYKVFSALAELERRQARRRNEASLEMQDLIGNETDERKEQIRLANEELKIRTDIANIADQIKTQQVALEFQIDMADNKYDGFVTDEQRKAFLNTDVGQEAKAELEALFYELARLGKQLSLNTEQQAVALDTAAANSAKEKEKELQIQQQIVQEKQKEVQAQREILEIIKQFEQRRIDKTLRDQRLQNPFSYLTADNQRAIMERDSAKALIKLEKEQIEREYSVKKQMISAEYALLRARINTARAEADIKGDGLTEGQADAYNRLSSQLTSSEQAQQAAASAAADNAKAAADERLEQLEAEVVFTNELFIQYENLARSFEEGMVDAFASMIDGSKNAKEAFKDFFKMLMQEAARAIAKLLVMQAITSAMGLFGFPTGAGPIAQLFGGARYGGIMEPPKARYGGILEGYSMGGIAKGSQAGHLAMLHGTEAVVPLPNGRSIPVELQNGGSQVNNVSVSVNVENSGRSNTEMQGKGAEDFAKSIANVVQREIQAQKRPGGLLSPYGGR